MAHVKDPESPIVRNLRGLHLFHFDGAPCAQRVRFALHEKGLSRGREVKFDANDAASHQGEDGAWVSRHVSLIKRDHMTETYRQIHPNLVVPALVHDGELHIESMDIVEYLDSILGGAPLIPTEPTQLVDAQGLTQLGKDLHRSIRFVTFRWGLRGLARLSKKEESQLKELLDGKADGEKLISFYEGYDDESIPESVYVDHLEKLNAAFADLESRLQDNRRFLTGDNVTMADIIWAMKTLRLLECDYPFADCFPTYFTWYQRIAERDSFKEGVLGNYRFMTNALGLKAKVERLIGIGLRKEVLARVA